MQITLSAVYYKGLGVQQNYSDAVKYFELTADQNGALGTHIEICQ